MLSGTLNSSGSSSSMLSTRDCGEVGPANDGEIEVAKK